MNARFPIEGGCDCRARALPHGDGAAVRALLPLPLVPARDRRLVRAERDDRGGPRRRCSPASPSSSTRRRRAARARRSRAARAAASRSGATTPAPAGRFPSSASARSTSPTPCRRTSTSSRPRSSPGSCCRRARPPCRSTTTASSTGRRRASPGARRYSRRSAGVRKWRDAASAPPRIARTPHERTDFAQPRRPRRQHPARLHRPRLAARQLRGAGEEVRPHGRGQGPVGARSEGGRRDLAAHLPGSQQRPERPVRLGAEEERPDHGVPRGPRHRGRRDHGRRAGR